MTHSVLGYTVIPRCSSVCSALLPVEFANLTTPRHRRMSTKLELSDFALRVLSVVLEFNWS